MGHIRLGELAQSRRWDDVVELLEIGGSVEALAGAVARAAEGELTRSADDPALVYSVWLLTQLPLAARSDNFDARLQELGFDPGSEQSLIDIVSGFTATIDRHVANQTDRTDLGEMAQLAAAESLSALIGSNLPTLFDVSPEDVRLGLGNLASKHRFAALSRDFFTRLTQKTLEYYISRELPKHVGPGKPIPSIDSQIEFRQALEKHCRESSRIVEEFAGGWYSKQNFQGGITPDKARRFTSYVLKKMRDELRKRGGQDD